jgi:hypothetical protein
MHVVARVRRALCLTLVAGALPLTASPAAAAGPPTTCTASLTIATTSTGTVRQAGAVQIFRDSGVGGAYTSGFLSGYSLSGAQDIVLNSATKRSQLNGSFVATSPDGKSTLRVRYTGQADLTTGAATGHFVADEGSGALDGFRWTGTIAAQLVSQSPPTFTATDSGPCFSAR